MYQLRKIIALACSLTDLWAFPAQAGTDFGMTCEQFAETAFIIHSARQDQIPKTEVLRVVQVKADVNEVVLDSMAYKLLLHTLKLAYERPVMQYEHERMTEAFNWGLAGYMTCQELTSK